MVAFFLDLVLVAFFLDLVMGPGRLLLGLGRFLDFLVSEKLGERLVNVRNFLGLIFLSMVALLWRRELL